MKKTTHRIRAIAVSVALLAALALSCENASSSDEEEDNPPAGTVNASPDRVRFILQSNVSWGGSYDYDTDYDDLEVLPGTPVVFTGATPENTDAMNLLRLEMFFPAEEIGKTFVFTLSGVSVTGEAAWTLPATGGIPFAVQGFAAQNWTAPVGDTVVYDESSDSYTVTATVLEEAGVGEIQIQWAPGAEGSVTAYGATVNFAAEY